MCFLLLKNILYCCLSCRLWKEKCLDYELFCPVDNLLKSKLLLRSGQNEMPYKDLFVYCHKLEMNWRCSSLRPAMFLKGHDDHVVTCLQYDGVRIVSASDDNTLKVWSAETGHLIRTLVGHTGNVCLYFT